MAGAPDINVRVGGDATPFNRVIKQTVDNAEDAGGRMSKAFDGAGNAAGGAEGKFMGAADVLDGLGGAFGIPTEGATNMMRSFGDLSGGFAILQPAIGGVTSSMKAMGMSMLTNPIFLVIAGVVALGAALYFAYTRSETFRAIVDNAFRVVAGAFQWMWGIAQQAFAWIADNWKTLAFVIAAPIAIAVAVISSHWDKIMVGVRFVGDVIASVFQGAWGTIKTIFNAIAWGWNNTLGRLSIKVPDVPGLPFRGQTFNVPDIPVLHSGGVFQAPAGQREGLALLEHGERVIPAGAAGGGAPVVNFYGPVGDRATAEWIVQALNGAFARGAVLTNGRGGTLAPAT